MQKNSLAQRTCLNCDKATFFTAYIIGRDIQGRPIIAKNKRPVYICEDCLPLDKKISIVVRGSNIRVQRENGNVPWIRQLYLEMLNGA